MIGDLDFLLDPPKPPVDTFRWATVTGTGPIRIRFDGDTNETPATPADTIGGLMVGDRVWVQHHARSIIIIGRQPRNDWIPVTNIRSTWEAYPGFPQRARRSPSGVQVDVTIRPTGPGTFSSSGQVVVTLPMALRPPMGADMMNALIHTWSNYYSHPISFRMNEFGEITNLRPYTSNLGWLRFYGEVFF